MADGKITIETELDSSGAKKDLDNLKNTAEDTFDPLKKSSQSASDAIENVGANAESTAKSLNEVSNSTKQTSTEIDSLDKYFSELDSILDNVDSAFDEMSKASEESGKKQQDLHDAMEQTAQETQDLIKKSEQLGSAIHEHVDETKTASQTYAEHKKKLDELKQKYIDLSAAGDKESAVAQDVAKEIKDLSKQVNDEARALDKAEKEADQLSGATEEVGEKSEKSGKKMEKFGNIAKGALKGSVAVVKGIGAGIGVASVAVAGLVKQSVDAYSNYEQLVGGVNTLFGAGDKSLEEYAKSVGKTTAEVKDKYNSLMKAQSTVMKNAAKAYTTAGLSANAYMEQITGFSASLVQSLGGDTEKAAEVGNRAIIDMSDNANKMGTSMEMIQNAYQGFAKQNYTMLDNLKLGYGGTKEEMQRLISDAAKMTDIQSDLNLTVEDGSLDFGNIINAISVMQTSLGIAGTTSKEAASTIEGSTNAMKASWENLLVGVADDQADFDTLVNQFVDSVTAWSKNIMPRIEVALQGASKLIANLLPMIVEKIPELLTDVAPELIRAGTNIITTLSAGFIKGLPDILQTIQELLPQILEAFYSIGPQFDQLLKTIFPQLLQTIVDWIPQLLALSGTIIESLISSLFETLPQIIDAIVDLLDQLSIYINSDGLTHITDIVLGLITSLVTVLTEQAPKILDAATKLLMSIVEALPAVVQSLVQALPNLITALIEFFGSNSIKVYKISLKLLWTIIKAIPKIVIGLVKAIPSIIKAIIDGLFGLASDLWNDVLSPAISKFGDFAISAKDKAVEAGKNFFTNLIDKIKDLPGKVRDKVMEIITKIGTFVREFPAKAKEAAKNFFDNLWNGIKELPNKMWDIGSNIVEGIWNGIGDKFGWLTDKIQSFASNVTDKLKNFFGIHSPSRVMRDEVGKFLALGIAEGITRNEDTVVKAAEHLGDKTTAAFKRIRASQAVQFRVSDEITTSVRNSDAALARSLAISQTAANKQTQAGIDYKQMGKATAQGIKSAGIAVNIDGRKAGRVLDTTPKTSILGGFA